MKPPEQFLSIKQAADYAGVSVSTVRRWIIEKLLPVYHAGRQIRIDKTDLVAFLRGK